MARRGNTQAYGELVQRFQSAVFSVCYQLVGERAEAEDLAQDAFIRAYWHLDQFNPSLPFGPWVRPDRRQPLHQPPARPQGAADTAGI